MEVSGDAIAEVALQQFATWEKRRKPLTRTNGVKEWVPFSGIVVQELNSNKLTCLASATGMKCLPQKHIAKAQGIVLHDWHAEILAIRSFNRFLLDECLALANSEKKSSSYLRLREEHERTESHFQPFALVEGLNIHMYCSEAPCGDASMELTIAAQTDSTPWALPPHLPPSSSHPNPLSPSPLSPPTTSPSETQPLTLHGRAFFSLLGLTRRKPSRPDAPPTLSKSCTDKLAATQTTSLLSSLTSLLISPERMYIHSLILPHSQLSRVAVERAFSPAGRLAGLAEKGEKGWGAGYEFQPFKVLGTTHEFPYSRRNTLPNLNLVSSNLASSYTPHGSETTIGGTLQGRKQFDILGASRVSKRRMWKLALEIAIASSMPLLQTYLQQEKYSHIKDGELLQGRRRVKEDVRGVMGGWVRNEGGEEFGVGGVEV